MSSLYLNVNTSGDSITNVGNLFQSIYKDLAIGARG